MGDYTIMPYYGFDRGGWPMRLFNEEWSQYNHGQGLQRLAERGGLTPQEALAIVERRHYHGRKINEADAAMEMDRLESELLPEG